MTVGIPSFSPTGSTASMKGIVLFVSLPVMADV